MNPCSVSATALGSPLSNDPATPNRLARRFVPFLLGAAAGGLGYAAYKGLKKAYKCGKYGCPPDGRYGPMPYGQQGYMNQGMYGGMGGYPPLGMGGMGGYGMGGMGGYGMGGYPTYGMGYGYGG
ncbi:uncharacterized protein LOC108251961 [Diaphorina citri]|uniref:Uncharacterized protein LOC108251961 n=1 Tax=Diaphorina citri TaxID=121845 RepID=A0A1S4E794_DIACI|nr:uncharacterized protein LOC108251961 [Diaphorina citri]